MSKSFDDLLTKLKVAKTKKLSVAVAQDEPVLEAVKAAKDRGIAEAILVGDIDKTIEIAEKLNIDLNNYELIDIKDLSEASLKAVELVSSN